VAASIFTQAAGKLMFVCRCVCGGGYSGSNTFYTGCCKKICVCFCVFVELVVVAVFFYTGCGKTNVCVSVCF
jgi:hypothetical protein